MRKQEEICYGNHRASGLVLCQLAEVRNQDLNLLQKKKGEKLIDIERNIQDLKIQLQITIEGFNIIKNGLKMLDTYDKIQKILSKGNVVLNL